jgi:hypothetical protein
MQSDRGRGSRSRFAVRDSRVAVRGSRFAGRGSRVAVLLTNQLPLGLDGAGEGDSALGGGTTVKLLLVRVSNRSHNRPEAGVLDDPYSAKPAQRSNLPARQST